MNLEEGHPILLHPYVFSHLTLFRVYFPVERVTRKTFVIRPARGLIKRPRVDYGSVNLRLTEPTENERRSGKL